ncbi:MAG: hypothetical protein WAN82_03720 [Candidatus Bathyarchaeia archaeon]
MVRDLLKKALKKPHRIPHYLYWKLKILSLQYYYRIKFRTKTFRFQGYTYNYFYHRYNMTWQNERTVEVPIVWGIVKNHKGRILEVGNALSHYHSVTHDIVDKYEKAEGVINQDIVDFRPFERYDLIVSISTMEHVGWDENPRDSMKVLRAIENLKTLLVLGGKIIITFPLDVGFLDRWFRRGKINFTRTYYLKRISKDNRWIETDWKNVQDCQYNVPFPCANGLVIGEIE